jgi:polygalacturonase
MRWTLLLAAASLCLARDFRVNDYGAKGDGKTVDTAAIQRTIDAAAKEGGTVVFAAGTYLTGSVFLKSGTRLQVDKGVELRGVQDLAAYPVMRTRVAGIEMDWPSALINIYQQHDVNISGEGTIDGDGKIWWDSYAKQRAEYTPRGLRWASDYDCQRPRLIQIYKSENVELRGLMLKRSGFWTVHICYSNHVTVDGITIRNNEDGLGPSTDGVDVDSSSNVVVENADISCNDDAVVLKAGRDSDGLRVNRPTENVVIHDITVRAGAAGVTFGSETSGGIRHVEAYRIHVMAPAKLGILFKSARTRGGMVEDVSIHDVDMRGVNTAFAVQYNWNPNYSYAKIPDGMTNVPDYWRALAKPVPPEQGMPHLRDVKIANVKATEVRDAFGVSAYPEAPIEGFTFAGIDVSAQRAGTIQNAKTWKFTDTRIRATDGSMVTVKDSSGVAGLSVTR